MKRLNIFILSFYLFTLSTYAQNTLTAITDVKFDQNYEKRPYPVINGKINNATVEELKDIELNFVLVLPKEPIQTTLSAEIANDGTFQLQLPNKLPYQQIWFSLGDYVYSCLYANEELNLAFDLQKLKKKGVYMLGEGMEFAGKDGEVNHTLNAYIMYNKKHLPDFYKELHNLEVEDGRYIEKLDSLFNLKRKVDSNFIKENRQIAKEIIESETELYYASKNINHSVFQNGEIEKFGLLKLPVYAITNESAEYLRSVHRYINKKKLLTIEERKNNEIKFLKIDSLFPSVYADMIKLQVSSRDLPEQLKINKELEKSLSTRWIYSYLQDENKRLEANIRKINELLSTDANSTTNNKLGRYLKSTPFQADFYLNEAKSGQELLKLIRAAFPEKYIIIDLWATWCAPCIANMPNSKRLQLEVDKEGLPVVFVYLCTDANSSEIVWQNKVAELEQPGAHIFVQNKHMNDLLSLFNGIGYPTYAVIKPNGKIDTETIGLNRNFKLDMLKMLIQK